MNHLTRTALAALLAATLVAPAQAQWVQVPLRSAAAKANGQYGGEGCQVVRSINCDSTGNVLAMITDVGGLYKSTNGGALWQPMNATFKPRGGNIILIDPNNSSVMIADGQGGYGWDGLWRQGLPPACTSAPLSRGPHTLRASVTGSRKMGGSGAYVSPDRVQIAP